MIRIGPKKYIFILSCCMIICFRQEPLFGANKNQMKVINGQTISYLLTAFDDYSTRSIESLRDLKYLTFHIEDDNEHFIVITIQYNYELLRKNLNLSIKGGGARYEIDKKNGMISKKKFYK